LERKKIGNSTIKDVNDESWEKFLMFHRHRSWICLDRTLRQIWTLNNSSHSQMSDTKVYW
jgi:hypothetical protein